MATIYLIKTEAKFVSFDCHPNTGLTFTTSVQNISFLNNVVINGDLKILVQQDNQNYFLGKPFLWVLVKSDKPMNNTGLEEAWKYATKIAAQLHRYTKLGQSFSYKNIWSFPNIPDDWVLGETYLEFKENGQIEGIYWDNPADPVIEKDGETEKTVKLKTVNADYVAVIENENNLTQTHLSHFSLPCDANINAGLLRQAKTVLAEMDKHGFNTASEIQLYLLQLYNRAISSEDIFISFIFLFQMVEVIIRPVKGKKISPEGRKRFQALLAKDEELSQYMERLINSATNITIETSAELLAEGANLIIGEEKAKALNSSDFSKWRKMRGQLTHPEEFKELTEREFVEKYKSIRKFCADLVQSFYE